MRFVRSAHVPHWARWWIWWHETFLRHSVLVRRYGGGNARVLSCSCGRSRRVVIGRRWRIR